ncbi:HDOD domain-containing protein [Desulfopila sp. IMCC35006]|uniref:EAL and HDOD domain-containing protein n=1 Tax=Desulfopila sp. IMCC35006 TaxID=2569542 RepID=UPI0010ABA195|nr:HDOD domain-containing protein [Desulfopila sp. IMCC35006]TKB28625.1 HDOD domain-containing protein [Desulfopila sp. IMCC35006]
MDLFIARQPILTVHRRLYGYELLYRGTKTSSLSNTSGNKATTSVLSSAFLTEGIERISGLRPCFINFTRDLLLQNLPASFPKKLIVVEILEDVQPTPDIIDICKKLHNDGYTIALDDFVYNSSLDPLLAIADIIKFDFLLTPIDTLQKTLYKLSRYKLKYLAEKVESYDEFIKASKLGFSYFQGYFFCKPEKIRIREIDSSKINLVNLLAEVNKKTTTLGKIEKIVLRDVALAYKLLRYINSSYFYRPNRIDSVAHAITYLGENELRRFIILVLISELASDKPGELVRLAVVRAKMGELLAAETSLKNKADEIFLLGLFSLLEALLDTTIDYICEQLSLSDNIKDALVSKTGPFAPFLDLILSYEKRDKASCLAAAQATGVPAGKLAEMYLEAITFTESVLD